MRNLPYAILFLAFVCVAEAAFRTTGALGNGRMIATRMLADMVSTPDPTIVPSLMTDTSNILSFLHLVQNLKLEKRTGWHLCGIPYIEAESIADHMYRMGIMACMIQDSSINKLKSIKMALVHDMAEAIVGDITPSCGISEEEKNRRETEAMQTIRQMLGDNPFGIEAQELWHEYAADVTVESQFVKDIDKTELVVQVVEYENKYKINFQTWIDRSIPKIRHPGLKAIANAAILERPAEFNAVHGTNAV